MNNDEIKEQKSFFAEYHFATEEEFEKALKNPKTKEQYDKMFEEEKEEKSSIKK